MKKPLTRTPLPDDQEKIQEACQMLAKLVDENKHIEVTLWTSAMITFLVATYKMNGASYTEFYQEMLRMLSHVAEHWDELSTS